VTIFLHIGTHKTGTTAIQRHLGRNADFYASQGLWYPRESELLEGGRDAPTHLNIARSLDCTNRQKAYAKDQLRKIAQAIASKSRNYDHTIISAEAFWRIGFGRTDEDKNQHERWTRKAQNIAEIRSLFKSTSDIEAICVIRERISFIQKNYSELILATRYHKSIHKYIRSYSHLADYRQQLDLWRLHFPIRVLSYENLCTNQDITERFLLALGIQKKESHPKEKDKIYFNIGHPLACVLYKRYLNSLDGLSREKIDRLYSKRRRHFTSIDEGGPLAHLKSLNSWLMPETILKLRKSFQPDDNLIREYLCPEFISGSIDRRLICNGSIKPVTREAYYLTLGWMLSRKRPSFEWFHRE